MPTDRIGKVLRIPIEVIPEDEEKLRNLINEIKGDRDEGGGVAVDPNAVANLNKVMEKTNLKDIMSLTKESIQNVVSFAKSPATFLLSVFLRRFAKGAGAIALAFVIMEAIKFAINWMMADGMPLDRRFKRYIQAEVLGFLDRLFKAELRQGFRSVIVTTIGGLRGGRGQVSGNLFAIATGDINAKIPMNFYAIPIDTGNSKGMRNFGSIPRNRLH